MKRKLKGQSKTKRKTKPSKVFHQIDWTQRYGDMDTYKLLCARTHAATFGTCCVCMKAKSEVIHHSRYLGKDDTPGKNVFACCNRCHNYICHTVANWIKSSVDPLWGNHNTVNFEKRLQESYKILNQRGSFTRG